jgi:chromosome segregation ATPase
MWVEENHHFVRMPVPKSFDRCVDRLQERDSVLFASISLPSILDAAASETPTRRSKTTLSQVRHPLSDVSTSPQSVDSGSKAEDSEKAALLRRIQELEEESAQKDQEIARLQHQLQKKISVHNQPPPKVETDDLNYKQEYEALKFQYDKLREVLAVNGKVRRIRVKSAQAVKLAM